MSLPENAPDEERQAHVQAMADYLVDKILRANGWEYSFEKHTNTDFKVHYLNDLILDCKRQGFHVVGMRADYLGTINKTGHGNGIAGAISKSTVWRVTSKWYVTTGSVSPTQISPEKETSESR